MAAPSRATLLFPPDRDSERRLDSVGAVNVLGAMVEQRRQSQPPPPPSFSHFADEEADEVDEREVLETHQRPVVDKKSLGFIKLR